jgi:hypothetical protein
MNKNATSKTLSMGNYAELIKPGATLNDVINQTTQVLGNSLEVPAKTALVFEVR